jgi:hypothetical protein
MKTRAVAAAVTLVVLALFPAGATADAHHYQLSAGGFLRFQLESSNGYLIRISSNRSKHLILRADNGGVSTEYRVRGDGDGADQVRATLPGLGQIDVRFHQRGPAHHPSPFSGCDGPRPMVRRGVVRGTIKFVGEREYTQVIAHSARAETEEWVQQRCRYGTPGRISRHRRDWTNEFQVWEEEPPLAYFSARKYRPGVLKSGRVVFTAETDSYGKTMRVSRWASVIAPASAFRIPEPDTYPEHVIFTPPPPFSGTGTFARTPESVFTWEGDLLVQFPGIDPVPLTGPRFEPHYCALRGCIEQEAEESEPGFPRPTS